MVGLATDLVRLAEKEEIRRQENVKKGERLVARAERAVNDKNLKEAYKDYLEALQFIPAGSATNTNRQLVINEFSKIAVGYARELIQRGQYTEAENAAKTVLAPEYNPNYKPAAQILSQLEKGNYNTTPDPTFAAKLSEVQSLLTQAEGYYATGRNDLAIKRYEQVLNLDPYNTSARNGMEQVNLQRENYYKETYNETRSRLLWLADRAWEKPVRKLGGDRSMDSAMLVNNGPTTSTEAMVRKLNGIVIDRVNLQNVTLREAVEILKQKSREFDESRTDSKNRGVNIVLKIPAQTSPPASPDSSDESSANQESDQKPTVTENSKVTLDLRDIPLPVALRYLCDLLHLKTKIEPFAVSLIPESENTEDLITKKYRVSPSFIPTISSTDSETASETGRTDEASYNQKLGKGRDAKKFLEEQGVPFPPNSFARYSLKDNTLTVFNTQGALDLVDTLVEADVGAKPMQVEIESKFLEISQNNVNELGFDWMLGPFSIGGGVFGNGGTTGGEGISNSYYNNFPFGNLGAQPVTAGNRSGIGTNPNSAITANSLNALLAGIPQGANVASPGILGIGGIFTNPQFQMVIRALSQQKGVDLMSAPKVTTKSGNSAKIKMVREFTYPTEFDPPEVPEASGSSGGGGNSTSSVVLVSGLVTPATPAAFDVRELGVNLEVLPEVEADNYTINLSLTPEVVEFDGFVNYGSPIIGPRYSNLFETFDNPSGIRTFTITENVMNQPVFSVRRVTTNVSIWDGQTVAMGGLIREDVQKVNDKVPILGDIPLAGRLFRSNVDQKIKKNLIIFVTARLLDASGQPLIQEDEAEEIVEPLGPPDDLPPPQIESRTKGK